MDVNHPAIHQAHETSCKPQTQSVIVDIQGCGTAIITLNRALKRNALSAALIEELNSALRASDLDDSIRSIVLTGPPGGPFSGRFVSSRMSREPSPTNVDPI